MMGSCSTAIDKYIEAKELAALLEAAVAEDLGPERRDLTTLHTVDPHREGTALVVARQPGCFAGAALLDPIAGAYDQDCAVSASRADGAPLEAGTVVAHIHGRVQSLLAMERVLLNFLTHLSGVATLTAKFVAATTGTSTLIQDTRKTLPGLRKLQRYAVACGGGTNHRAGLYDAVLIKDNHLVQVALQDLGPWLAGVMVKARRDGPSFIEVEVDSLEQLDRVLPCQPDIVLLDNMDQSSLCRAVAERDRQAPSVRLEASGGISLENVAAIAQTGVNSISIGALTHSAPALDMAMDIRGP